jgi:hypothetical protein
VEVVAGVQGGRVIIPEGVGRLPILETEMQVREDVLRRRGAPVVHQERHLVRVSGREWSSRIGTTIRVRMRVRTLISIRDRRGHLKMNNTIEGRSLRMQVVSMKRSFLPQSSESYSKRSEK